MNRSADTPTSGVLPQIIERVQSSELLQKHRQRLEQKLSKDKIGSQGDINDSFLAPIGYIRTKQQFHRDGFSFNKEYIRE